MSNRCSLLLCGEKMIDDPPEEKVPNSLTSNDRSLLADAEVVERDLVACCCCVEVVDLARKKRKKKG